jgi:hypothetical protein
MTSKLMFTCAALSMAAFAGESYRVTLFQESSVNGTTLKPGDYRIDVNSNKAVIKGAKNRLETDVRVEDAGQKFGSTSVRYSNEGGKYQVQEIRLGGTKTKLVFAPADSRPAGE